MNMKLYFRDAKRRDKLIAEPQTVEECKNKIEEYIKVHNLLHRDYRRVVEGPKGLTIDYGSHFEFFYIEGVSFGEYIASNQEIT